MPVRQGSETVCEQVYLRSVKGLRRSSREQVAHKGNVSLPRHQKGKTGRRKYGAFGETEVRGDVSTGRVDNDIRMPCQEERVLVHPRV